MLSYFIVFLIGLVIGTIFGILFGRCNPDKATRIKVIADDIEDRTKKALYKVEGK